VADIHDKLGAGHTESVYHNAMKVGLQDAGYKFETERDILIKFRDIYVGTVRADLIVEGRLVIELKSSNGTDSVVSDAKEQCNIYMRETNTPSGVVVVFPKRVGSHPIVSPVSPKNEEIEDDEQFANKVVEEVGVPIPVSAYQQPQVTTVVQQSIVAADSNHGICSVCRVEKSLNKNRTVRAHKGCSGGGKVPV
jgi:GxxExxY protein